MRERILKEMRLIDANQLEVISWRAQGGREYANGFDDGVDYVVQKIDKAKTINAIPIDWLREVMMNDVNNEKDSEAAFRILELWQKEHEVEDSASN